MALSLSLGEPRPFRFGPVLSLPFNDLLPNPAKTQIGDPKDNDGNVDGTRGRRVARDASVNRRIAGVGSHPNPPSKPLMTNDFGTASGQEPRIGSDRCGG
ncbi:hypothetical protein LCGC14_2007710 [marine sediment metagenome]|uniref:Uncharacterized protein n=1 Tax=marine sediment metagenome TaxID=412755 RepID=A0A0F9FNS7_9ZZZZ